MTANGRPTPGNSAKYKFQRLQVYQLALDHVDVIYRLTNKLRKSESLNLRSHLERAATSVVLNIADGSTGQTDPEQARFLRVALRSLMEGVTCLDLIERHNYVAVEELIPVRDLDYELFVKLQAMRHSLTAKGAK